LSVLGVTVTEFTIAAASTRTFVEPDFVASKDDVAVIVAVPAATPETRPVALTLATVGALLLHVTAVDAPPTAVTLAVS
jgi:hypothetical protein